ncbi:MAG TPA: glycosyltransferase family 2 protein [Bryobacteraceae bacterium]
MSATQSVFKPSGLADSDCTLLLPENDAVNPEFSIVLPAMNERLTIGDTIEWCKEGFRKAGVTGEILIIDSSSDDTPEIAIAHGARVLKTPKRGLGRAYIDAIPFIRANNILMGDADCTYDFREIDQFVHAFHGGFEFIMGSRFRGYIEAGAMPGLHRHFGTPLTTAILNFLYSSHFSDIHCGMRGITKPALQRIQLESQSWEYASEMVLKSACMSLRTTEVPVRFLKDREGRSSHMKRGGIFEPWRAGWINLRAMFIYHADFFVLRPGLVALVLGLLLALPETFGPFKVGSVTLSLYWMLFGMTLAVTGLQSFYLGCIVQVMYGYSPEVKNRWVSFFSYTRALIVSALLGIAGLALTLPLAKTYLRNGLSLPDMLDKPNYMAVIGLLFLISSFMTFSATLVLHAAAIRAKR